MRVLSSLVLIFVVGIVAQNDNTRIFEDTIVSITECIRELLKEGVPENDVPSFDPLELESATADFDSFDIDGLSGYLTVTNIHFAGVTDFIQSNVAGNIGLIPPRYVISFDLLFPLLSLSTEYDVNLAYTPAEVSVFGTGELSFEAVNFGVSISATVTILGGIELSEFYVWPSLEGVNSFVITGLFNDDAYSADITERILADASGFVAQYAPDISSIANEIALKAVNNGDNVEDSEFISGIQSRCL